MLARIIPAVWAVVKGAISFRRARSGRNVMMDFYEKWIVPALIDLSMRRKDLPALQACVIAAAVALLLTSSAAITFTSAHEDRGGFSAGAPGDPKKPARVVKVKMFEGSGKMGFEPARIEVRKGQQVRFVLQNDGEEDHEFVLATVAENRKHAEVMKKHPDMEHDDPNAKRLQPSRNGELVWKFTRRGEFEFACLIPGHYEKGMFGKVIVK
jgi:uncharacterized cupredoxin-like copper-binding protein